MTSEQIAHSRTIEPQPMTVALDQLHVDRSTGKLGGGYGRGLSERRIQTLVKHWDQRKAGRIEVSRRLDGSLWIIDGQHRYEAAKRVGETTIRADVYDDLTVRDEADQYLARGDALPQQHLSKFWARIARGDQDALRVLRTVEDAGLRIAPDYGEKRYTEHGLLAVASIERLFADMGQQRLFDALKLLRQIWPGSDSDDSIAYQASFLRAWAKFIIRYRDGWDEDALVVNLHTVSPATILRGARSRQGKTTTLQIQDAIGLELVDTYNRGRRTRKLPGWFETGRMTRKAVEKARQDRAALALVG